MTDEEIIECRNGGSLTTDCQCCPDYVRCAELVREEYLRQFGPEPSEDLPTAQGEWVRATGGRAEYDETQTG